MLNRKNRIFVRPLKFESNQSYNFLSRVRRGGGHVSFWDCMSGSARDPLVMYSGKVNGPAYIKMIEEALPTFIEDTFDSSNKQWVFMQDNASPHQSAHSLKWLKNNRMNVLKSAATSSDLNLIENRWDYTDKKLQKMKPKNIDELQQMTEDIWCDVTSLHCRRLVNSMPDRIKQCIKFRGGMFKKY